MPELPGVEALAGFLRERAVGRVIARIDVGAISVLKTYDPPVTALHGLEVTGVARHGKFLDVDVSGLHLVVHLSRAGWLRWSDSLPGTPIRPGKSPIALRVRLDDPDLPGDPGFDLTEAGTQKRPPPSPCPVPPASTSPRLGRRSGSPSTSSGTRSRCRASPRSAPTRSIPRSTSRR